MRIVQVFNSLPAFAWCGYCRGQHGTRIVQGYHLVFILSAEVLFQVIQKSQRFCKNIYIMDKTVSERLSR